MRNIFAIVGLVVTVFVARMATGGEKPPVFPERGHSVMTWVAPYAIARSKARLDESFGDAGMKDGLTHLGLQFWCPTRTGGVERVAKYSEIADETILKFRDWGHARGVRVLLCVYNGGNSWDWALARGAFAEHREEFVDALVRETTRLELDGVDIDLEGNGVWEGDREPFANFVKDLSARLHAMNKHLTVDSFSYKWNAPNQGWWKELLPLVDGLTTMGYDEIGSKASDWRGYPAQKAAAGEYAAKLMIGMPSGKGEWRDGKAMEHLEWVASDGGVGVAFWDAQLQSDAWRKPEVWKMLGKIRGKQ